MDYTPIKLPIVKTTNKTSYFANKGENLLDLSSLLNNDYAKRIDNLLPIASARLVKCSGSTKILEQGTTPITGLIYHNSVFYYGQDNRLYGNNTLIKTMAGEGKFSIVLFGDYLFATNGTEKVGRISRTLNFDNQTANYTVGEVVTGGTSGATAVILEQSDLGATGTLTLGNIDGVFINNELLTSATGSADVDGVLGFAYNTITLAPICKKLFIYNKRLACGNISTDGSRVICSNEFVGTFPPFDFAGAVSPPLTTDQFNYSLSSAGDVLAFGQIGNQLVTFYENGVSGIRADVLDYSGLGVRLNIVTDFQRIGEDGTSAISTKYGIFYTSTSGVYQMRSGGNDNQIYSENQVKISRLFDDEYIKTLDFSESSLYLDEKNNLLLISCAEKSTFNNLVLIYNLETKAWTRRTGWYINDFYTDNIDIYSNSSLDGKIYRLFDGGTDEDREIKITFEQELTDGTVLSLKQLKEVYMGAKLSYNQTLTVYLDIYDKAGEFFRGFKTFTITSNNSSFTFAKGIGTSPFGTSGIGYGGKTGLSLIETWVHKMIKIFEYSRIIIRIEEESGLPLELNWVSLVTEDKGVNKKYTY